MFRNFHPLHNFPYQPVDRLRYQCTVAAAGIGAGTRLPRGDAVASANLAEAGLRAPSCRRRPAANALELCGSPGAPRRLMEPAFGVSSGERWQQWHTIGI
jgi:hypothetical protein